MTTSTTPQLARETYQRLAPYYDDFTAHHDYELWLGNLLPELHKRGLPARGHLLDLACGTGKSFLPVLARGWAVTGVDISPAMLERARAKVGADVDLRVGDVRDLPSLGQFDLVWCLDDAVNYLLTPAELKACLEGFRRNLGPEGLGLFDVNTLGTYRGFFASTETVERGNRRLVWRGQTSPDAASGTHGEATVEVRDSRGELVDQATHHQRHFDPEEIAECIAAAELELLAVFGHGTDAVLEQPLDEVRHTKAIFIVRSQEGR